MNNKVAVFLEERFVVDQHGRYFSTVFDEAFWNRYLSVFDQVEIVARAEAGDTQDFSAHNRVDGPKITLRPLPSFRGGLGFILSLWRIFSVAWQAVSSSSCFILRAPGGVSVIAALVMIVRGKRYGVELVGDPYEVFSSSPRSWLSRRILSCVFLRATQYVCRRASGISYVSMRLQERYGASRNSIVTSYSSIDLPDSEIVSRRIIRARSEGDYLLLAVGSMEQPYKGFDVLLAAFREVLLHYPAARLAIVGEGACRASLENLASQYQIREKVSFLGRVPRTDVFQLMDQADLLVVPSRTEGLPRVVIEALAKGLPCIGSRVGGIPDLLPEECLVAVEDAAGLARAIARLLGEPDCRERLSADGLTVASAFSQSLLTQKRNEFYAALSRQPGGHLEKDGPCV